MAKRLGSKFVCQECGAVHAKWSGKCPVCGAWNSLLEERTKPRGPAQEGRPLEPVTLSDVSKLKSSPKLSSGLVELDRVLGGGIVPGSITLLAGEPGIGKSTLLLQMAAGTAVQNKVLYISGEESLDQLKLRAARLKLKQNNLELASSVSADDVAATIEEAGYGLVIVDSIQTMATSRVTSAAGSISQVTSSAQLLQNTAKTTGTAVIVVGHVTKEGNIAGPKLLEHIVDTVLYLEGERFGNYKILRSVKNRFGPTYEVGIFEMAEAGMEPVSNPSAAFLHERTEGDGSVVFAAIEGSRPILVEIQALTSASNFGYPKRTASGFDLNRLNLLIAVLGRRAGIKLGSMDVYVNVVGGMRVNEPAADLAIAMAIASSSRGLPILSKAVIFGEVGLNGEVRSVSHEQRRISEAKKQGFAKAIAPGRKNQPGLIAVKNLSDAIKSVLAK